MSGNGDFIVLLWYGMLVSGKHFMDQYQKWFYPYKNANYLKHLYDTYPKGSDLHKTSQLPEIQHFQPQLSPNRHCVAEIMPGYKHMTREWVMIECTKLFPNVYLICESHATEHFQPGSDFLNESTYANITYIVNNNGTLIAGDNYCKEGWLHMENACFKIYPYSVYECVDLTANILSTLDEPPFKYITQHFTDAIFDQAANFSLWVIPYQLIHFFADPSPILMKFGKLGGQQKKQIHTKFQLISTIFNGVRAL